MVGVRHLIPISVIISSRIVEIRRIAIKEGFPCIIELYHFQGWTVLDLDTEKPFSYFREILDRTEPATYHSAHPGPRRILAVRPSSEAGSLGKPCPHLPRADIETARTFDRIKIRIDFTGQTKLFTRERRKANGLNESFLVITKNAEEVCDLSIEIIVRLNWRRGAVY